MKFAHLADTHLGYEQYHLPFRADDFARSFGSAVERILEYDVDFVVISGDLFHRSNPSPKTIKQAIDILSLLKKENIPVFAVEGNHDKTIKDVSIYDLLESLSLLFKLGLRKSYPSNEFLKAKNLGNYKLVYANYDGINIFGDTHRSSHQFKSLMEEKYLSDCDIAVLHLSVKEVVDFEIRDDYVTLKDLPKARYYALGHVHIPISKRINNSWFVYPGCPERYDAKEFSLRIDYFDELTITDGYKKGFFVVEDFKPRFVEIDCRDLVSVNMFAKDHRDAVERLREIFEFLNKESLLVLRIYSEGVINIEEVRSIVENRVKSVNVSFEKISKKEEVRRLEKLNEVFDEFELNLLEYLKRRDFEDIIDTVTGFVEREFGLRDFKSLADYESEKKEEVIEKGKEDERSVKRSRRTLFDFLEG